ncbi:semialdehyde dehydrogenase, partial [Helicosporidium sp. ATCC 50920]
MAALPVSVSAHSRVSGASASLRVAAPQRASLRCRSSKTDNGPVVAIAGATGAVGQEFLKVLDERSFPYSRLRLFASARSAGKVMRFQGQQIQIEELTEEALRGVDVALFSAGGSQSKKFARGASSAGVTVVDNSSAFRMTEGVPLVIPEVNPEAMREVKLGRGGIVANPNCSTIIALMAATPLRRAFGAVRRMVVSTYQAASGAGQAAMDELELQTRQVLAGEQPTCEIFPQQYAFNMFSHNSPLTASGYNEEELKLVHETRKIWGDD